MHWYIQIQHIFFSNKPTSFSYIEKVSQKFGIRIVNSFINFGTQYT